jgi:hypothetical protein
MCLRRVPEKYITGAMAPVGAALDRAALEYIKFSVGGLPTLCTTSKAGRP